MLQRIFPNARVMTRLAQSIPKASTSSPTQSQPPPSLPPTVQRPSPTQSQPPPPPTQSKSQPPSVLILGWGGSTLKNLRKLQDYYASRGVDSYSFVMPLGIPQFLRDIFEEDISNSLSKVPSLHAVHSYSNNGAWVYGSLCEKAEKRRATAGSGGTGLNGTGSNGTSGSIPRIERLIMDAAPFLRYEPYGVLEEAFAYTAIITSVVMRGPVYHHPYVSPLVTAILIPYCFTSRVLANLDVFGLRLVPDQIATNIYLRDRTPSVPTLLLYTRGDKLIPASETMQYAEHLRKRGVPVETADMGDHPHTSGFFANNAECAAKLDSFLGLQKKTS